LTALATFEGALTKAGYQSDEPGIVCNKLTRDIDLESRIAARSAMSSLVRCPVLATARPSLIRRRPRVEVNWVSDAGASRRTRTDSFATPPLLKSVDEARFSGPDGIFTGFDQHVCYSTDRMASSVDTFKPQVGVIETRTSHQSPRPIQTSDWMAAPPTSEAIQLPTAPNPSLSGSALGP
jgi:hypothetical protein